MRISSNGLAFIAREEGTVLHVYKDIAGKETVGVGHLLTPGEIASGKFANGITQQQALDLLSVDVATAEGAINKDLKVAVTQNMFDALCSFTFNLGTGALAQSTLLKDLNLDDLEGAADNFLAWDKAVIDGKLQSSPGLHARRARERALFLTPDPKALAIQVPQNVPPAKVAVITVVLPTVPEPVASVVVASVSPWQAIINFIMMLIKLFTKRSA
jgi:lysozyme